MIGKNGGAVDRVNRWRITLLFFGFLLVCNAGKAGVANSLGAAAFAYPTGVAVDSTGNAYVADSRNYTIRKITPAGVVTTLAGAAGKRGNANGSGAAARFNGPFGVATDSAGNVYVADSMNNTIRKITPTGAVTTFAGSAKRPAERYSDGVAAAARFAVPFGIATDRTGNVYVGDTGSNTIRKITPAGVVTTLAGTPYTNGHADGKGAAARFDQPEGVAIDSVGNLYVADTGSGTIRKVTPTGVVTTLAGTAWQMGYADGTGAEARFTEPEGIATDTAGTVYVADTKNHAIRKITPAGVVTTLAGITGSERRKFRISIGGDTDKDGPCSRDGSGVSACFSFPSGVATDSAGNVYVADTANQTIRKITSTGVVTTLAGTPGVLGHTDGFGADKMGTERH